jgi:quercetin 2,3-dioxygenase
MQRLTRNSLPLGGFAGLREYRVVTDSRVFGNRKSPATEEGLGQFVYLADAQFNPHGETGMHPHKEIDVISVMIDGRVGHAGSLEHGKRLEPGDVQVQRAGGEGFTHNEINPDDSKNRMIQLWALPNKADQPAGYKYYTPKYEGTTRIYGGNKDQSETFDSTTMIDIVRLEANTSMTIPSKSLSYVTGGEANFVEGHESFTGKNGDLIRANDIEIRAMTACQIIVVGQQP